MVVVVGYRYLKDKHNLWSNWDTFESENVINNSKITDISRMVPNWDM